MEKVVFFDVEEYEKDFLFIACEGKYDYNLVSEPLNDLKPISKEFRDAKIISCFTDSRVNSKVLSQFSSLELIALRSVGFNHIDIDYCKAHNISVVSAPNYGNKSVAEFAMGLLLDVSRKITRSYIDLKLQEINPLESVGFELYDKTIGILGLGAIGSELARIAHGFGMIILGFDIYQRPELIKKYGVKYVDFDYIVENSDIISLHMPLTKDNTHIFNKKVFKKMKKTAVLINTARGELVDTQALYAAILNKEIAGAGLDVLENEETLSNPDYLDDIDRLNDKFLKNTLINNRLLNFNNVVVTPHIAYDTTEAINRILKTTIENIDKFLLGKIQNNVY